MRFMPWAVPANFVTLASNGLVYVSLWLSMSPQYPEPANRIVVAALLLLYLIGDHLDGMQAKRTGTGSALGEFCDHYLDAFNNGVILFTLITLFDIRDPRITAIALAASYLAHASVFYEQFKTGWITFERVGSLEGVLITAVVILLTTVGSLHDLFGMALIHDLLISEVLILLAAFGAITTFIRTIRRTPHVRWPFWVFCGTFVTLAAVSSLMFPAFETFLIITLYASLYVGKVMRGHLADGKERPADWLTVVLLPLPYVVNSVKPGVLFPIIIVALAAQVIWLIIRVFSALQSCWLWSNPKPQ
jgi:ethanolaminephosphotransferase